MNRESLRCCCEFISSDFTIDFKTKSERKKERKKGRGREDGEERWRQANLDKVKVAKSCKYLVDSIVQLIEN